MPRLNVLVAFILLSMAACAVTAITGGPGSPKPSCSSVVEGEVTWPQTAANTISNQNCPSGFSGRPSRLCDSTGNWGTISNPCTATYCPAQNNFMLSNWTSTRGGTNGTSTCPVGYSGTPTRYCQPNGYWSSVVVTPCLRNHCPELPRMGQVYFNVTVSMTTVVRPCPRYWSGAVTRYCDATGTWGPPSGSCFYGCGAETYQNVVWPNAYQGQTATGSCAQGATQNGPAPTRLCGTHNIWSTTVNNPCSAACATVDYNGATYPGTPAGQNATGECDINYTGTAKRYCDPSGTWSTEFVSCTPVGCPDLHANGATYSATLPNHVAAGTCDPHYTGSPSRTCQLGGSWGAETSPCVQSCLAVDFNGASYPETAGGHTASGSCDAHYTGSPSRACTSTGGVWGAEITSCVPNCPAVDFNGASYPETPGGQTASGSCDAHYTGSPSRVCTSTGGAWGAETTSCVQSCLAVDFNGASYPETPGGQTATGSCDAGYSGTPRRACTSTGGAWGAESSSCVADCPPLSHQNASLPQTQAGHPASVACDAGFTGSISAQCSSAGQWGSFSGSCTRNTCGAESFGNATWTTTNSLTLATGTCITKFTGSPTRYCGATSWDSTVGNGGCTPLSCAGVKFGPSTFPTTLAGNYASGTCDVGYRGPTTRQCLDTGVWQSYMVQTCTRNVCKAVTEGNVFWNYTSSLQTVTVNCPTGFSGKPTRTCQGDGTWGPISNGCVQITCPAVDQFNIHWPTTNATLTATGTCITGTGSPTRLCQSSGIFASTYSGSCT